MHVAAVQPPRNATAEPLAREFVQVEAGGAINAIEIMVCVSRLEALLKMSRRRTVVYHAPPNKI